MCFFFTIYTVVYIICFFKNKNIWMTDCFKKKDSICETLRNSTENYMNKTKQNNYMNTFPGRL